MGGGVEKFQHVIVQKKDQGSEEVREELPHSSVCIENDVQRLQHSGPAGRSFPNSPLTFRTLTANWCNY